MNGENEEEGHHTRDREEDAHDRESESGNVRDRNGEKHDDDDVLTADLKHDDEEHIRGQDWNGDDAALLAADYMDTVHVRGQDRNGQDELTANLLHDDDEHVRGQDVEDNLSEQLADGHDRDHVRGQDWDGEDVLVADEHVRGQDWNGEDEEFVVIHDESGYTLTHHVSMSNLRWILAIVPAAAIAVTLICYKTYRMLRRTEKEYVPLLDGSGKSSKTVYGV